MTDSTELQALLHRATRPEATEADREAVRHAADELFAVYQERIYWLCLRLAGRPELASELAQEAMLTAWRRLPDFRGESGFYAWLYSIARYTCLRALHRKGEILDDDHVLDAPHPGRSALAQLRQHERDALVEDACHAVLEPLEQEAVLLRYSLGMGYDEITAVLGIPGASGARGVLQTCKRKLRPELERRLARLGAGHSLGLGSIGTDA